MTNLINCGTCGYPLTPEERTTLVEHNGVMMKPEQEPVVTDWNAVHEKLELVWHRELSADEGLDEIQDLIDNTTPQRKWVGLTGEEHVALFEKYGHRTGELVGAVEDKLKEKNT